MPLWRRVSLERPFLLALRVFLKPNLAYIQFHVSCQAMFKRLPFPFVVLKSDGRGDAAKPTRNMTNPLDATQLVTRLSNCPTGAAQRADVNGLATHHSIRR